MLSLRSAGLWIAIASTACGSSSSPAVAPIEPTTTTTPARDTSAEARAEKARRAELAAAHREIEDEQATALAATCDAAAEAEAKRCLPSCYTAELADPRASKKKIARAAEVTHLVCTRDGTAGPFLLADEIDPKLVARAAKGRVPKAAKKGSWQAEVEAAMMTALKPELGRGDVVRVIGTWKTRTHPATKERLRCVTVSHRAKALRRPLDACGGQGGIACEAMGSAAAHGINVVRYRLLEAKQLQRAGKSADCQKAALEAIAVARGMPRWRQYASLNTDTWKTFARYRTRFDGLLDEDTLFTTAMALGVEAESVYAACGGSNPKTTVDNEQSFHRCW